jgi:hypothetical protein
MRFVEARCGALAGELRHGEPPQADVLWHVNDLVVGIEITDGLFDATDGRELYGSLRSRVALSGPGGFLTASSSDGSTILTRPDVSDVVGLAPRLTQVGNEHCASTYAPADELVLVLNAGARPLRHVDDAARIASLITLKSRGPFDQVYVCFVITAAWDRAFVTCSSRRRRRHRVFTRRVFCY